MCEYSGAADLEKVTDYAEEKEIGSSSAAEDAIAVISNYHSIFIVCTLMFRIVV